MYDYLMKYTKSNSYPMHMPGHKRNPEFMMVNPYSIDMTEIEGMDNLHHPESIIRDCMDRMKRIYGTKESWLLVGGSTCGILAAVSACCHRGDTVLVDRGCHRSVYHAMYLLELNPVYLMPEIEPQTGISVGISPYEVEKKLEQAALGQHAGKIAAVILTSPTYEGVVSDINGIAEIVHRENLPLIVDEAHGAHFPWAHNVVEGMPESAICQGADLVIQSIHKTLPSLTQTALLHLCSGRVSHEMVERYLDIYETSSPSYVLMASVDQCMTFLEEKGEDTFIRYGKMLSEFYQKAKQWKTLVLWEHPKKEPSKLVIHTGKSGITGPQLGKLLRSSYGIEIEMEAPDYALAMTNVADSEEGFRRLMDALTEIDWKISETTHLLTDKVSVKHSIAQPIICISAYEAMNRPYVTLPVGQSNGRVSAEYAMVYPPGVPFLVPGESITEAVVQKITEAKRKGLCLLGLADDKGEVIRVLSED